MYENKEKQQTALLAAVDTGEFDVQRSVDELEELAKSAGAVVKGRVIQRKERPDPATLMGAGRLEEVAEFVRANEIDLVSWHRRSRRIWKTHWMLRSSTEPR